MDAPVGSVDFSNKTSLLGCSNKMSNKNGLKSISIHMINHEPKSELFQSSLPLTMKHEEASAEFTQFVLIYIYTEEECWPLDFACQLWWVSFRLDPKMGRIWSDWRKIHVDMSQDTDASRPTMAFGFWKESSQNMWMPQRAVFLPETPEQQRRTWILNKVRTRFGWTLRPFPFSTRNNRPHPPCYSANQWDGDIQLWIPTTCPQRPVGWCSILFWQRL